MNTRELRIGNWVYAPTKCDYIPARIVNLGEKTWMGRTIDGKYIDGLHDVEFDTLKSIKPIELTEQMLCNNGFEYVGEHEFDQRRCFLRYGGGDCIMIYCTPNHTDFRMTIRKDSTEISEFPCQYLHELQNLYYEINKKELDFKF